MILDADTPLFKAAKSVQTDFIIASNETLGIKNKRFKNVTEFWGHYKKKEGGWLADFNLKRMNDGLSPSLPEHWVVEEMAELSKDITGHLDCAFMEFNSFIGKMKRTNIAEDYILCIGGDGNFRYDVATYQPYKGTRKDKPLLFHELKQKIIQQYNRRIILANEQEADDVLGILGWNNYLNYRKTGEWDYVLGYIDKDINMIISPSFNYDDKDIEVVYKTPEECAKSFCVQLLAGDSTDNIAGLPNFTKEIQDKYSLGKTRGVGVATARRMLRTAEHPKEMYKRVVEAYKSYYGDDVHTFTNFRGEVCNWKWIDYLQDNAILLWMRRHEGEMFSIKNTLLRMGVIDDNLNII